MLTGSFQRVSASESLDNVDAGRIFLGVVITGGFSQDFGFADAEASVHTRGIHDMTLNGLANSSGVPNRCANR